MNPMRIQLYKKTLTPTAFPFLSCLLFFLFSFLFSLSFLLTPRYVSAQTVPETGAQDASGKTTTGQTESGKDVSGQEVPSKPVEDPPSEEPTPKRGIPFENFHGTPKKTTQTHTSSKTSKSSHTKTTKKTPKATKSSNVKHARLISIDTNNEKITVIEPGGLTSEHALIEKTHYWKNRHAADGEAFHIGEMVVAHVRKNRSGPGSQVTELTDETSWKWLVNLRHETTPATVVSVNTDELAVVLDSKNNSTEEPEALPVTYTVSDKTLWTRAGSAAQYTDFKVGDRVYIVPRSLPGGAILAHIVADSGEAAAQMKERAAISVHGAVIALNASERLIKLATEAGDKRLLACSDDVEVIRNGATLRLADLKPGQYVSARVRHDDEGEQIVWRLTIEQAKSRKSVPHKSLAARLSQPHK